MWNVSDNGTFNNKPGKQKCNDPAVKGLKKGYYGVKNQIKHLATLTDN